MSVSQKIRGSRSARTEHPSGETDQRKPVVARGLASLPAAALLPEGQHTLPLSMRLWEAHTPDPAAELS